jgi:hypothetical protein
MQMLKTFQQIPNHELGLAEFQLNFAPQNFIQIRMAVFHDKVNFVKSLEVIWSDYFN